ncbi:MAG: radical SAM protein [Solidesulfovibrio sp. DCME]|uniref:radical SAM protein n=1 Tax=Solidesulfovibrio sp. DCME TaxID=3447380 RepID=UPI003D114A96
MNGTWELCPFGVAPGERLAVWELTRACPYRCAHCLVDGGEGNPYIENPADTARMLEDIGVREVVLSGGEPLLYPQAEEVIDLLVRAGSRVSICTTATLVDAQRAIRLRGKGLESAILSLDGATAAAHESIRHGPPSYAPMLTGCRALIAAGIPVDLTLTLGSHNAGEVDLVADLADRLGARSLAVVPLLPLGRASRDVDLTPGDAACRLAAEAAVRASGRLGMSIQRVRLPHPTDSGPPEAQCPASDLVTLTANGMVGTCPWLTAAGEGVCADDNVGLPSRYSQALAAARAIAAGRPPGLGCPLAAFQAGRGISGRDPLFDSGLPAGDES